MGGEHNRVKWRGVRQVTGVDGIWPAIGAVRVHVRQANDAEGTVIIYTVPAGRKLYLSTAILSAYLSSDQNERFFIAVRDESDVFQYCVLELRFGKAGQLNVPCHFVPALEAEAGWDVVLTNELL